MVLLVPLVCLATGAAGCAEVGQPGASIMVRWSFAGGEDCNSAEVVNVEIELWTADGSFAGDPDRPAAAIPCLDGDKVFYNVPRGDYQLWLFGVDKYGLERYQAQKSLRIERANKEVSLELAALQATLAISWDFGTAPGQAPLSCQKAGVEKVLLDVWDDACRQVASREADCEILQYQLGNLTPGLYVVSLRGVDDAGMVTFMGTGEVELAPGDETSYPFGVPELNPPAPIAETELECGPPAG